MKNLSNQTTANNNSKNQMTFSLNFLILLVMTLAFFTSCQKDSMDEMDTMITENMANEAKEENIYDQEITAELLEEAQNKLNGLIDQSSGEVDIQSSTLDVKEGASNEKSGATFYTIQSNVAGHNVGVNDVDINVPIRQYTPNQTGTQLWRFYAMSDGYYFIQSKASGKFMTVYNGSKSAKAAVVQDYIDSDIIESQKWRLVASNTTGYYYIVNKASGMVLDVQYASNESGAMLWQYPFNGTAAQKFKFKKVTAENYLTSHQYGGTGGSSFFTYPPEGFLSIRKISRVYIRHGKYIDSVQVEWELLNGEKVWSTRGGGTGGTGTMITLDDDEYITFVGGSIDKFINSLSFQTNKGRVIAGYGEGGGQYFTIKADSGIKGFFGKAGSLIDKIGVVY